METVTITVNGKSIQAEKGQQLLAFLRGQDIHITALCYHSDFKAEENCRLCLVEVNGKIVTSCNVRIKEGMIVQTNTEEVKKLRRVNTELLLANYMGDANALEKTILGEITKETGLTVPTPLASRKKTQETINFDNILSYDLTKCVDCRNCVKACQNQGVCAVTVKDYGYKEHIAKQTARSCVYCGQCLTHCPSGAVSVHTAMYDEVKSLLAKKQDKPVIVAQVAPAVRAAIGEAFGLPYGTIATEQLTEGLKKLGFDFVFDTSVAADLTTIEEAKELVERLQEKKNVPMFTSCCPGWVRYMQVYFPKLLPLLTTVYSPQIMMGGLIKTYWAKNKGIPKENIHVVSIMPCVAKKWEAQQPQHTIDGVKRVDTVITTAEIANMMKEKGIDIKSLKGIPMDSPMGKPTGAGVLFGASGGVMVAALRSAVFLLTGKNPELADFEEIKKLDGYKTMVVNTPLRPLSVAVIDGLGNVGKIITSLSEFDYIEIMACRGGCIGGGGQPVPVNDEIRKKRAQSLFQIDTHASIRFAHDNPDIKTLYKEFLTDDNIIHTICHNK